MVATNVPIVPTEHKFIPTDQMTIHQNLKGNLIIDYTNEKFPIFPGVELINNICYYGSSQFRMTRLQAPGRRTCLGWFYKVK